MSTQIKKITKNKKRMENLPLILPVSKDLLLHDLSNAYFVKEVDHKSGNERFSIYTFTQDCPNLMSEVGRLRELTFRQGGGGTGHPTDIDRFDEKFIQLIVWDPTTKEIVGGYRYAKMIDLLQDKHGHQVIDSPTAELFNLTPKFVRDYALSTIELGRSFIQPSYQNSIFSLDNLFEGLGTLAVDNRDVRYFFGKVTMYKHYNREARNMILYYLSKHYADMEKLIFPKSEFIPPGLEDSIEFLSKLFSDNNPKKDRNILQKSLKALQQQMPPLFKKYLDLSPSMRYFGTAINLHFGDVEESAILVDIDDIFTEKKDRYLLPYLIKRQIKKFW